jgi:hypothetical protein
MTDNDDLGRVFSRTAVVVAYVVFIVGTIIVFAESDFRLLRRFASDFPSWRSLLLVAGYAAIALLISPVVRAVTKRLTRQ